MFLLEDFYFTYSVYVMNVVPSFQSIIKNQIELGKYTTNRTLWT